MLKGTPRPMSADRWYICVAHGVVHRLMGQPVGRFTRQDEMNRGRMK